MCRKKRLRTRQPGSRVSREPCPAEFSRVDCVDLFGFHRLRPLDPGREAFLGLCNLPR